MIGMMLRPSLRQQQRIEITQAQKLKQKLAQTVITPRAMCPECGYRMDEDEVRAGWLDDPQDFTTACPECNHRFVAALDTYNRDTSETGSYRYLCQSQLFYAIRAELHRRRRSVIGEVFLERELPELFWNTIRHFGTYKLGLKAYKKWSRGQ